MDRSGQETLGTYTLLAKLGAGGMGEVHLARDPKLNREVALKVLPAELSADEDRRARFLREAQAAAKLNHPNITTIFEIGEAEGRDYIAFEHVVGRTLTEVVREKPLELLQIAELGLQLADGLAYAHEQGVIHRDLKPDNVMVTERGLPKLLDFGLAKLKDPSSDPVQKMSTTLTVSGAVFGTPTAMSPEQALGRAVDERSDVFSFGGLLYEMAGGRPPFHGTTVMETLDAIVHADPEPLHEVRRGTPAAFCQIVEKALRKEPAERYQSMADLAADLRHFRNSLGSGPVAPLAGGRGRRAMVATSAFAALVVAITWLIVSLLTSRDAPPPRLSNARPLTSAIGVEMAPCWSPQGTLLAYHARQAADREFGIWVMQDGSSSPVRRTAGLGGDAVFPSISPDGKTIAFWLVEDIDLDTDLHAPIGLYTMPVLAGAARQVLPGAQLAQATRGMTGNQFYGPPQWSADSQRLAFVRCLNERTVVQILSVAGQLLEEVPLPQTPTLGHADLAWSSDGRFFAFVETVDAFTADTNRLWTLRVSDGQAWPLTDSRNRSASPSWSADGRYLYYVGNQRGSADLWRQPIASDGAPDGDPIALGAGLGLARTSFSADGKRLAYSRGGRMVNVWRVPLHSDRAASWSDAQQITFDEALVEYADVSPDGRTLVVGSTRAGNPDLWLMPADGGEMQALTTDPTPDWFPRWSPDGESVLFYAARSGNRDLWVIPSKGGPARQLTKHAGTDWFGEWSPDGLNVSWTSTRDGEAAIYASRVDEFEPRRLPFPDDLEATRFAAPWISNRQYFVLAEDEICVVDVDGVIARRHAVRTEDNSSCTTPDRGIVFYIAGGNVQGIELATGKTWAATDLRGRAGKIGGVMCSSDEHVWFTWYEERGDLWTVDVESGND